MIEKIRKIAKGSFFRNLVILLGGSAAAQIPTIALTPIVARLFTPELFGIQGVFLSITGMISVVANLRYETAIVLPKSERSAFNLFVFTVILSMMISLITWFSMYMISNQMIDWLKEDGIRPYIGLMPMSILLGAVTLSLNYWSIRQKRFALISTTKFLDSISSGMTKIIFGITGFGAIGLILGVIVGQIASIIPLMWGVYKRDLKKLSKSLTWKLMKEQATEYKEFPLYSAPQGLLNTVTQTVPVLILTAKYGTEEAGFFIMCRNLLLFPITFISQSFRQIFIQKVNEVRLRDESVFKHTLAATLFLSAIGIVPLMIVMIYGKEIFQLLLGQQWTQAGVYSQWIITWVYFALVLPPTNVAASIMRLQKFLLLYEIVLSLRILIMIIFSIKHGPIASVASFCVYSAVMSIIHILYVLYNLKISQTRQMV